jgi:pyruvate/2-oxoglutarate dehydrogenase complex dihydrolipoamide acyltransferase (E2) component
MTPRHALMAAALLGAAALAFFGDKTTSSEVAEAVVRPAGPAAATGAPAVAAPAAAPAAPRQGTAGSPATATAIARLQSREALLGASGEDGKLAGAAGAAIFQSQNWAPPASLQPQVAQAAPPPPPPTAPPLPFTVLGKAVGGGSWEVYLERGGNTYIVHDQSVIDGVYRVERIAPPTMTITYLPMKQVQQLNIGVLD